MSQKNEGNFKTLPVGRLGIIPLTSCLALGKKVDNYLVEWRTGRVGATPEMKTMSQNTKVMSEAVILCSLIPRVSDPERRRA